MFNFSWGVQERDPIFFAFSVVVIVFSFLSIHLTDEHSLVFHTLSFSYAIYLGARFSLSWLLAVLLSVYLVFLLLAYRLDDPGFLSLLMLTPDMSFNDLIDLNKISMNSFSTIVFLVFGSYAIINFLNTRLQESDASVTIQGVLAKESNLALSGFIKLLGSIFTKFEENVDGSASISSSGDVPKVDFKFALKKLAYVLVLFLIYIVSLQFEIFFDFDRYNEISFVIKTPQMLAVILLAVYAYKKGFYSTAVPVCFLFMPASVTWMTAAGPYLTDNISITPLFDSVDVTVNVVILCWLVTRAKEILASDEDNGVTQWLGNISEFSATRSTSSSRYVPYAYYLIALFLLTLNIFFNTPEADSVDGIMESIEVVEYSIVSSFSVLYFCYLFVILVYRKYNNVAILNFMFLTILLLSIFADVYIEFEYPFATIRFDGGGLSMFDAVLLVLIPVLFRGLSLNTLTSCRLLSYGTLGAITLKYLFTHNAEYSRVGYSGELIIHLVLAELCARAIYHKYKKHSCPDDNTSNSSSEKQP